MDFSHMFPNGSPPMIQGANAFAFQNQPWRGLSGQQLFQYFQSAPPQIQQQMLAQAGSWSGDLRNSLARAGVDSNTINQWINSNPGTAFGQNSGYNPLNFNPAALNYVPNVRTHTGQGRGMGQLQQDPSAIGQIQNFNPNDPTNGGTVSYGPGITPQQFYANQGVQTNLPNMPNSMSYPPGPYQQGFDQVGGVNSALNQLQQYLGNNQGVFDTNYRPMTAGTPGDQPPSTFQYGVAPHVAQPYSNPNMPNVGGYNGQAISDSGFSSQQGQSNLAQPMSPTQQSVVGNVSSNVGGNGVSGGMATGGRVGGGLFGGGGALGGMTSRFTGR